MKIDGMAMFITGQQIRVIDHEDPRVRMKKFTVERVERDGSIMVPVDAEVYNHGNLKKDFIAVWPEQCRPV